MADHGSRTKGAPRESWLYQQRDSRMRGPLAGERHIIELISLGAPLPGILNKLCTAIDVQIGNVVSLILLPGGEANRRGSVDQSAKQVGLHIFDSIDIWGRDKTLLGTLEIYSCDPRTPTEDEYPLIERAVHLAAIALQRYDDDDDFERASSRSRDDMDDGPESPPFIN